MAGLGEIVEELREGGGEGSGLETGSGSVDGKNAKRRRSRRRRKSGGSEGCVWESSSSADREKRRNENESGGQKDEQQRNADREPVDPPPTQEDHRAWFFEHYRKEAEEYDKEFLKKYDEDLNTTLIFAGLFSAVTSAFILDVQSQLQPDTGEETAALLRVLISKIDNTTFGNNPPTLPQWSGPPHMIVQVQAILYASLAASLLSAFLAMLGKQWLNRYASTDIRGTAIERSQNRQRKLDGIAAWYFDPVMESLPLMLQAALLLLGCALSRYLWAVDIAVAPVVIGVTSSGIILYLFFVAAGVASESCPYQTPGSHAIRYMGPKVWSALRSAASAVVSAASVIVSTVRRTYEESETVYTIKMNVRCYRPWWSRGNIGRFSRDMVLEIPCALVVDVYRLARAMGRTLVAFPAGIYHLGFTIVGVLVGFIRRVRGTHSTPEQGPDQRTTVLDLPCISWMVQTSSDKAVHLSTLKHLTTIEALADFNPTLVADCFSIFIGCINVNDHKVTVMQGSEQLATVVATCLLRTFCHLLTADPTSSVLADVRRRYQRVLPFEADFTGLPFRYTVVWIHALANRRRNPQHTQWDNRRPSAQEHTAVARDLTRAAQGEYRKVQRRKVPRWILHFTLHSLSLTPPPPMPVVADCLSIIAIDLGCDVSGPGFTTLDESARVEQFLSLTTQKLQVIAEAEDYHPGRSERKVITTLLPYAIRQERDGRPEMLITILHAARTLRTQYFMWHYIGQYLGTLFSDASPSAIVLVSPYIPWNSLADGDGLVQQWVAAAFAVAHTEEIGRSVVDALLQIASEDKLMSYIPIDLWSWLTRRPSFPPICRGRDVGTRGSIQGGPGTHRH